MENEKMDKELKLLEDLEWEYFIAIKLKQDEAVIKLAKGKYTRQLNKVLRMQRGVKENGE